LRIEPRLHSFEKLAKLLCEQRVQVALPALYDGLGFRAS
jgi:hypothetical protein